MARLWHGGAEAGHSHAEGLTASGSTWTYDTTTKRSGTRSWKLNTTGGATQDFAIASPSTTLTYYSVVYLYIPTADGTPGNSPRLIAFDDASFNPFAGIALTPTRTLQLIKGTSTQIGSDSAALAFDTWHRIELAVKRGSTGTGDGYIEGKVNGTSFASSTTESFGAVTVAHFEFGTQDDPGAGTYSWYFDDVALNDSSGSVNNTFVGDQKVVILLPASDNSIGGWTGGAGGTTNLFDAVNNLPPTGAASPGTNASQIGNAVSSTTDNCDLNMETYSAKGLVSGDTVTAMYLVVEGGNSSTTGTDTLRISNVSNPAISETSPSIDIVVGTYPTGWNRLQSAIVENPTVTLGTAPVARVGKNIANTRRANVCFEGLYVSYAPSAGTTINVPTATATGAGVAPSPKVSPAVPVATATGAGLAPKLGLLVPAATATGTSPTPTLSDKLNSPTATATGASPTPAIKAQEAVPTATATGNALTPTMRASLNVPLSTAAGDTPTPVLNIPLTLAVDTALATGASPTPTIRDSLTSTVATASGTSLAPTLSAHITSPVATATGDALNPSLNIPLIQDVSTATASSAAQTPAIRASIAPPVPAATGVGIAPQLGINISTATASGASPMPAVLRSLSVPVATATGVAPVPTFPIGEFVEPTPATVSATAQTPTITRKLQAPVTPVSATAKTPSVRLIIAPVVAAASAAAQQVHNNKAIHIPTALVSIVGNPVFADFHIPPPIQGRPYGRIFVQGSSGTTGSSVTTSGVIIVEGSGTNSSGLQGKRGT